MGKSVKQVQKMSAEEIEEYRNSVDPDEMGFEDENEGEE